MILNLIQRSDEEGLFEHAASRRRNRRSGGRGRSALRLVSVKRVFLDRKYISMGDIGYYDHTYDS